MIRRSFALIALLSTIPQGSSAQEIRGLVLEEVTDVAIALARVTVTNAAGDSLGSALTDEQGFFSVRVDEEGTYALVASALGYQSTRSERFALGEADVRIIQLTLPLQPVPVGGVLVEADELDAPVPELVANGFYERLREGKGEFLTPAQIRNHPAAHTPQLFREMTTVRLVPNRDGSSGPWNDSVKIVKALGAVAGGANVTEMIARRTCAPMIWVDDVYVEMMPGEGLADLVPKAELEAVEVFQAPFGAPLRYYRDNDPATSCGVLLLWTNRMR